MTETESLDPTISEIRLLSDIARANQNYLSLKEVTLLTSTPFTEDELRAKWESTPQLSSNYKLESGLFVDLGLETPDRSNRASDLVKEKHARAQGYLGFARAFVAWTQDSQTKLISISGSTSYFSTGSGDDLDFFVVSARDNLWGFLFKSLLLARVFRLLHSSSPRICFSYAVDETFAEKVFAEGDRLMARDALNVVVIRGESYYHNLVRKSGWISKCFPLLYEFKTRHHSTIRDARASTSSPLKRCLNLFFFRFLGQYIRIKSNLLNRQFLRDGRSHSVFTLRYGPDHCIFDSQRYSKLRQLYSQSDPSVHEEQKDRLFGP